MRTSMLQGKLDKAKEGEESSGGDVGDMDRRRCAAPSHEAPADALSALC